MTSDIYREQIVDHYKNPRNFGPPPLKLRKDEKVVVVKEANASCGDLFELALNFQFSTPVGGQAKPTKTTSSFSASNFQIKDVKFRGVGCAISTASFSMLSEKIKDKNFNVKSLGKLTEADMVKMLGIEVSPTRMKCATLPLRALKKALTEVNG